MRINSSSSSSMKTTTTTPKISEKSFNHSKKLENFWRSQKEIHRQTSTNHLAVRRSCTIQFFNVNIKGVINSRRKTWHKISNAPGDVNKSNTSTFKRSNAPGDVRTNILRKLRNKCKTRNIFGQQTEEANSIFRSNHQLNILKPTLITSLKKIDAIHRVQSIAKTASSLIKSISINVCLPQGRDWPFLVILGSSNQHVTIRTSPDLFEINNNEAPNEEIWRHKLYHHLYIVYVSKLDWVHLIY